MCLHKYVPYKWILYLSDCTLLTPGPVFSSTAQYEHQQKDKSLLRRLSREGHSWKHLHQPQTCKAEKDKVSDTDTRKRGSLFKLWVFEWVLLLSKKEDTPENSWGFPGTCPGINQIFEGCALAKLLPSIEFPMKRYCQTIMLKVLN